MIAIENLSFNYGKKVALDKINLKIDKGEAIILAGANGAGKTTLLRNICGILLSKQGQIIIDDGPVNHNSRKKIAYLPSSLSYYDSLTLNEAIRMHASFYEQFEYRAFPGFSLDLKRKIGSLSRGERTLFLLTLALSASPDYLLIDDVVHFLDPHLREIFLDSILNLIEEKKLSLIIAAQVPVDIEGIIDRVIVFNQGKIVLDEPVEYLKRFFVKIFASEIPDGLPVVYKKEWQGMKQIYAYPCNGKQHGNLKVEHLSLAEILRAFIGGEYGHH